MIHLKASTRLTFDQMYQGLAAFWLQAPEFDRGEVHAQKVTKPEMVTKELSNVVLEIIIEEEDPKFLQDMIQPNLPWAEDHFKERVSGEPLNPPPSNEWWPFAQQGNAEHKIEGKFSHTYPERFWPRYAGEEQDMGWDIDAPGSRSQMGIRFRYGDLSDLIEVLAKNPRSRQAYLPVWFPEDLAAAVENQRVPCTLGYHFLLNREGELDASYYMRSCDLVRFFRDDVYMAGRLLQHVATRLGMDVGTLRLYIANLHAFVGDTPYLQGLGRVRPQVDARANYNFGALG